MDIYRIFSTKKLQRKTIAPMTAPRRQKSIQMSAGSRLIQLTNNYVKFTNDLGFFGEYPVLHATVIYLELNITLVTTPCAKDVTNWMADCT